MPRANPPRGRADHAQRVERVKQEAASNGLIELLESVAADPEAGTWSAWATRMLESDHAGDSQQLFRERTPLRAPSGQPPAA